MVDLLQSFEESTEEICSLVWNRFDNRTNKSTYVQNLTILSLQIAGYLRVPMHCPVLESHILHVLSYKNNTTFSQN